MTLGTHVAFASVLYLGGATLFGYRPDVISWLLAAGFSLLPDIDLPPAKIGRLFWFVSVPLERRFGHRTLTHSALGIAALALLSRINQTRPYFLLGEVEIPDGRGSALAGRLDSVDRYDPATYRGGILSLHYARAAELGPWLDRVAVRGEVVVQFWLKPGEAAVTLGAGEEKEVERIPEQLRRFL